MIQNMGTTSLTLVLLFVGYSCGSGVFYVAPKFGCPTKNIHPCECLEGSDEGISVVCDNTNLASMSVGLSLLEQTKMKVLCLKNCNIEKLYGDVFRNLNVTSLIIEDTPIVEISNDTFLVVGPTIKRLEIRNSRLAVFPTEAFKSLSNVQTLIIDHSKLTEIPSNAFKGLYKLKEVQLSNANIATPHKDSFGGLDGHMTHLRLYRNNITEILEGTFDFGTMLELLDLAHNRLLGLKPTYFKPLTRIRRLNLTDNGLTEVNSGAFRTNRQLAVLHMTSNELTTLNSRSFSGMRGLFVLHLDHNKIASVRRNTFKGNERRLKRLFLRGNVITRIDPQVFNDLSYLADFDLSDNQISQVSPNAFSLLQEVNFNLSHNMIEELPDETFDHCINMTLDLSFNNLKYIRENAFGEDSWPLVLNVSHNALTSFSQVPILTSPTLTNGMKILDASYNQITDIPKNSFPKLYELHTINFRHNNISSIGRSVFMPLFSIRHLDLSHNNLEVIESSTLGKIPTILDLDLSHNQIKTLKRGALGGLVSLRSIFLDHNQISDIPRPPISLNHFHLSNNKISEIKGRAPWSAMNSIISMDLDSNLFGDQLVGGRFDKLYTLQHLSLRNNNISKPPLDAISSLRSLRSLNLADNAIINLEKKAFGKIPTLSALDLSGNKLNNVSYQAFEGLLQIVNLTLSNNNLSFIPPGAFLGLVALSNLDLSHNRLEKLENKTHGLLDDCLSLRRIDLSYNNIPFVTMKMFPWNKWIPYKLEEIDLSYNTMPVLTQGILHGTGHLKKLNVSNNILNDIRADVLGNLTSLEVLDMSYNSLSDGSLRADRWGGVLPALKYLNVAYNNLYNIPAKHLEKFESLGTLDVRGNDLIHFYPGLIKKIKAGLDLRYGGNLLRCECSLRPIVQWIQTANRKTSWDDVVCSSPAYLSGKAVSSIREEQLVCDNTAEAESYEISPDVKFRNVVSNPGSLSLSWFVNTNEDVGDFRLELASLKHNKPRTLLVKEIGYNTRFDVLDQVPSGEELRMCLLVKTSLGRIRRWRKEQQCQEVGPFRSAGSLNQPSLIFAAILACLFLVFNEHL